MIAARINEAEGLFAAIDEQNRVTDHRIGYTSHQLESILNGSMDELTKALMAAEKEAKEKAEIK